MQKLLVTPEQSGTRLDVLITQHVGLTRGQIQKIIKSGALQVNGATSRSAYRLQQGDIITFPDTDAIVTKPIVDLTLPTLHPIFEDEEVLVIEKEAGVVVHGYEGYIGGPTLADALIAAYPSIQTVGEDVTRPGIVHRLDKEVSGVMVVAKTQHAFDHLKQQFQARTLYKEYLALVYGAVIKDHDVIELHIARSSSHGRMVARPTSQEGKEAITEYDVLRRFKNHTFVKVVLHTGRTHQIRVHFRAINHPIVGDKLYGNPNMTHIRPMDLGRIWLHSHKLRLVLPNGEEREFVSEPPKELMQLLETLPTT